MKKNEIEVCETRKGCGLFGKIVKAALVLAAAKGVFYVVKNVISEKAIDRENRTRKSDRPEVYAFMIGRNLKIADEEYRGGVYNTFMGGLDIDLSKAVIKEDVAVTCRNFMGGVTMKVPNDVNVCVSGANFMGGVANMVPENRPGATIYLRAECFMGGVCIRMAGVEESKPEADQAEQNGDDVQEESNEGIVL